MNCKEMEACAIERIREIMNRLDETGENFETAYDRVSSFFEREKGIHEMQNLINEVKEMERLEKWRISPTQKDIKSTGEALDAIAEHFKRLEAVSKLDDVNAKIKVHSEQKKTLHEVKRILHCMGTYDQSQEKELDEICC